MPTRLAVSVAAALDRDLIAVGFNLTKQTMQQLASNHRCSYETVLRHYNRIKKGLPPGPRTGGQLRVITSEVDEAITRLLDQFPWFFQDEIAAFLYEVFDIEVSQPTAHSDCLVRLIR